MTFCFVILLVGVTSSGSFSNRIRMKFGSTVLYYICIDRLRESDFRHDVILSDGGHDVISQKKPKAPSFQSIGMKFNSNILQINIHSLTDGVRFLIMISYFKMAAMTLFYAEKYCHLVGECTISVCPALYATF